jgi:hypothetical protein
MNSENINAEQRSSTLVRSLRNCSFCGQHGHRITNCNDSRINDFELVLQDKKTEVAQLYESEIESRFCYKLWLLDDIDNYIKRAFSVRKCGGLLRDNIQICCEKIINYIWGIEEFIPFITDTNMSYLYDVSPLDVPNTDPVITEPILHNLLLSDEQINTIVSLMRLSRVKNYIIEAEYIQDTNDEYIEECSICYEETNSQMFVKLDCDHKFCNKCMKSVLKTCRTNDTDPSCALCRNQIKKMTMNNEAVRNEMCEYVE